MSKSNPNISLDDWEPAQRPSPLAVRRSQDFWEAVGWKNSNNLEFHSYDEYLLASLLELDSSVRHYIPHPYLFRIGSHGYTPNFWVIFENGSTELWQLQSANNSPNAWQHSFEIFCLTHQLHCKLVTQESVRKQEQESLLAWELINHRNQYQQWPRQMLSVDIFTKLLGNSLSWNTVYEGLRSNQLEPYLSILDALLDGRLVLVPSYPLTFQSEVRTL